MVYLLSVYIFGAYMIENFEEKKNIRNFEFIYVFD